MKQEREAEQTGAVTKAFVNIAPSAASLSMFGVLISELP